jgi:hypothetical protein
MDPKASARLRMIGIFVLLGAIGLLWLPLFANEHVKYDQAIASTLAIGIGLLLLAEIGPAIKSLKAGGIEVELISAVGDKFNALETRICALEAQAASADGVPEAALRASAASEAKPPALDRKSKYRDDKWKERFGEEAERKGFVLSATFPKVAKTYVEIVLEVKAPEGAELSANDRVDFHLHQTFNPEVVPVVFHDGKAVLTLLAYGGFTVGAWIARLEIELELDLAEIKSAPWIVRNL